MKKILLLAATLLMGVCSWAQAPESGVYEIENVSDEGGSGIGRGYLVDYTSYANGPSIGDCPWTAHRAKHPEQKNGDTTCSYWYLYNAEDACYLFSLSTLSGNTEPKFLVVGSQSSKKCTWSTSKNAVEIVNNPNKAGSVGIRNAGVTATNEYLSMGCGTNSTSGCIMVDALTDGGAKLRFNTVEETVLTTEQKAVMAAGIALCQAEVTYPTFDAEKQYTLHATASKRGYLAYNPAETSKVGLADVTLSPYESKHPASTDEGVGINWKIEASTTPGKVYLYNTTCNKYLAKSGVIAVWAETKDNAQLLSVAEKSEGVCTFMVGTDYLCASCGWEESQGAVRFQSNYENAVEFTVAEVEGTDPDPVKSSLSVSVLNGEEEIALSSESATSVATATGIKFVYENMSDYYGYYCTITKVGEEDPIYGGDFAVGEGTDTDTFDAINFAKGEQYQVEVSFFVDGPTYTFGITGTYEEEGETMPTYTISSPRGDLFTDGNGYLLSTRSTTLANSRTTTNDKWVIINAKSNEYGVYIYNVEHKTFIGSNNMNAGNVVKAPMVEQPTMLYRWLTGSTNETVKNNAYNDKQYKETDYPWCIAEEYGKVNNNYYSINVCNWDASSNNTGLRLDKTSNYDDGNIFQIVEAGTISKADYEAIYNMIYGEASAEEVAEANELLAKTGAGYPSDDADARTALSTLLAQEEISKPDLASAVAAYKASTEIEMPKAGSTYYVEAQFVDGTSAVMTAKDGVLTFTKEESEKEASYVTVVTVDNSDVTMTIGTQYVHITCGSDAPNKEADVDGLSEEVATLTLVAGGSEQFGRFLLQGQASSGSKYYLTTRDDLDGTFAFVANTPADKFYDDNYDHNGHNRTSYYTFTEKKGDTTGISAVAPVVAGKAIFNLQGQRIQKLQKGINIVGGQKVIK